MNIQKIKINTDEAANRNPRWVGAGCVLRDAQRRWIVGAIRNLGITISVNAELLTIHQGLTLTWEKGYMNVVPEMDLKVVIDLIMNNKVIIGYNRVLVDIYKALIEQDWIVEIQHIYREVNRMAD